MAYWDIALMAGDGDLLARIAACASQEPTIENGPQWSSEHSWDMASQPGWSEAWASAVAAENPSPGRDAGVITDPMILSGVQAVNV